MIDPILTDLHKAEGLLTDWLYEHQSNKERADIRRTLTHIRAAIDEIEARIADQESDDER